MRFTHVLAGREIPEHIKDCLNEQPARSGMYNWIFVHKGEINTWWAIKDRVHEYDQIQINMTPVDMPIIADIRNTIDKTGAKTKLILNNDYVCECWGDWGVDPYTYDQVQRMGDMVFGTEQHQVSNMIPGAFVIPHPTNTKYVKRIGSDESLKENSVGFIYHWWAGETYLPHRTLERVKEKFGIKKARVYAYGKGDKMAKFRKYMWDEVVPLLDFPDFAQAIQRDKCLYDPNPMHTYGRNGVECALMGVPVVGSNRVFSYNLLFPDLVCDPYDFNATMEKFDIVFNQPERLKVIMAKAKEKAEYFNYDNSRKRWEDACKIAFERGGHEWYKGQ